MGPALVARTDSISWRRLCGIVVLGLVAGIGCAQEGARDLTLLPFRLEDVRLVESDEDGYLYWVSRLSGRFGDFSLQADDAVFRLDRGAWEALLRHLRTRGKEELAGDMPLLLRERRRAAAASGVVEGENFFHAWRESWAGIFQDLFGSRVLVMRHSTGELLRAERLYIGFARSNMRAEVTELRLSGVVNGKSVVLRLFADRLDRGADGAVRFTKARLTASESPDPGYDLRFDTLVAKPLADGSFDFQVEGAMLAFEGVPVLPLPGFSTNSNNLYLGPLQSLSASASSKFGARVQAMLGGSLDGFQDSVHRFLGLDEGGTAKWLLPIDLSMKRGPAIDPTFEYELPNIYQGRLTAGLRYDPGDDVASIRGGPDDQDRWRMRTQNRFFLSKEFRLDLEVSLRGDEAFLSEFYESEWKEDKEQETDLYLRYVRGPLGGEFIARPATNDFDTTITLLPEARGHLISLPVFDLPLSNGSPGAGEQPLRVYLTAGGTLGQRGIQDGSLGPTTGYNGEDATRGTAEARLNMPFWIGPVTFTPFAGGNYLVADDAITGSGTEDRTVAEWGISTSTELASPWGAHWTHRVVPEVRYTSRHRTAGRQSGFLPLGVQETLSDEDRMSFVLRNTWAENPRRRDPAMLPLPVFDLDLDIDYFPNADARPSQDEWSLLHTELWIDLSAMVGLPRFELYSEVDIDVVGLELERGRIPDAQYGMRVRPRGDVIATLEYREALSRIGFLGDPQEIQTLGTAFIWEADPKFDLELRFQYDLVHNSSNDTSIVLRRKGADFLFELSFGYDPGENNTSFGFRFAPLLLYQRSADDYATRTLPQGIGSL